MRWSVRLRATVVATVTVALALGAAGAVLVAVLRGSLETSASREAARRAEAAAAGLTLVSEGGNPGEPGPLITTTLVSPDPDVRVGFGGGGPSMSVATGTEAGGATLDWASGYATAERLVSTSTGSVTVQARASLDPARDALALLRILLLTGLPGLLLLVAGLTWLLTGRALAPVSAIRATFADITATDLHRRVPVPRSGDEIARLARTMNATLDRLERAVERHRQFVADAAHELRSPLSVLRTRLELGRREAPSLVQESLTDVDRLQELAADLLLLARLDAGEPPRADEVDLGEVAAEEASRPRREGIRISLDIAPDIVVAGSASHLRRMVGNLVDNAVRHAESTVAVRVTAPAVVQVTDDGPGIPEERRESVFDRFTRLDEARARDGGGSGLGLAIARDIARAHGGTLAVAEPDDGMGGAATGACLRAELPSLTADRPS
ncbi:HAMP domain-containing histidine kinase [Frankia sp. CNm7]|uniref:histidine kinase n=1 Tax=Frankia nepalensis TaxID=1836974 RepID=A0A937UQ88_9ACTN|nr:HAMP domain-containing sensor histidine kinase [Frankia nepalensis]MBL7497779.1 HAMP domain-containing histidine kinase [Frankia nepalensis]MBL7511282.1 HAMP domain-containing histidine kinase [Frankia nepalensis]MBL7518301.1 HAMP domain-containing histidine kinase [Frankia nepalensis]MBL7629848.1 HAMP domain-containing histidine kinase [Frankia nepalensis]